MLIDRVLKMKHFYNICDLEFFVYGILPEIVGSCAAVKVDISAAAYQNNCAFYDKNTKVGTHVD